MEVIQSVTDPTSGPIMAGTQGYLGRRRKMLGGTRVSNLYLTRSSIFKILLLAKGGSSVGPIASPRNVANTHFL